MAYERLTEEEKKERYRQIKETVQIPDYARTMGLTLTKKGRYFSLKEYDSVIIDPVKNCFYRNSGIGVRPAGSVIDFAMEFAGLSIGEAIQELSERANITRLGEMPKFKEKTAEPALKREPEELELPCPDVNMRRVYAYLIKSRYLDPDIVQYFVDKKMLYQDVKGNCVFVSRDQENKPVYACMRGTNTERRFTGDVSGCDYGQGFYIGHGSKRLIVTESVIDAMSVMTILKAQDQEWKAYDYMILAGVCKEEALLNQVGNHGIREILLALDNDAAGRKAADRIIKQLPEGSSVETHFPAAKDWNDEVKEHYRKYMGLSHVNF